MLLYHLGKVTNPHSLCNLVEYIDHITDLGRILECELEAPRSVCDVNKAARLPTCTVDGERNADGGLHEETVQNSAVVAVIVEAVDEPFILLRQRRGRAPDNTLVQVSDTNAVVLVIELKQESISAFRAMIDGARVGWVKNAFLVTVRKSDIDIALRNLTAGVAIAVHTHRAKVAQVNVEARLNDRAEDIVRAAHVVIDRIALQLGGLHRVRRRALLGEVDDRVRSFVLEELEQDVVFSLHIDIVEVNLLAGDFLPRGDANLGTDDRRKRITAELDVDLAAGKIVDYDYIVALV